MRSSRRRRCCTPCATTALALLDTLAGEAELAHVGLLARIGEHRESAVPWSRLGKLLGGRIDAATLGAFLALDREAEARSPEAPPHGSIGLFVGVEEPRFDLLWDKGPPDCDRSIDVEPDRLDLEANRQGVSR